MILSNNSPLTPEGRTNTSPLTPEGGTNTKYAIKIPPLGGRELKFLLLPFMWLFVLITKFRNFLYDKNILKTTYFDFPIINVGNLTVGGTGKTPHVEFLIRFFLENNNQNITQKYQINVLSRGYGRKTKGFLLANKDTSATEIGDEPRQYFEKFGDKINVVVCENRVLGATLIQDLNQNLHQKNNQKQNLIILDDAFQHRAIGRKVNILLTDYKRLFYDDFPFPVGRLREQRKNAERADFVIVSKCPADISTNEMNKIQTEIYKYIDKEKPIFFTKITYGNPINLSTNLENNFDKTQEINQDLSIVLLSGIAQPQLFEDFCREKFSKKYAIKKHFVFPDHHKYTEKNINEIVLFVENSENNNTQNNIQNIKILTTEKDAVKLRELLPKKLENLFYFLPIQVDFIEKKEIFLQLLMNKINKQKS